MKLLRPLAVFALTVGLAALLGDTTATAQLTKQEKKALRLKLKAAKAAKEAAAAKSALPPASTTPSKPFVPALTGPVGPKDAEKLANLIDEQIDKKLAAAKVPPSPLASDEEFLRRAYLDLTGVIPSAEQAHAFLASTDPKKRARLIDELLESPNFGRHLADTWQAKLMPRDTNSRFLVRDPLVKWLEEQFNQNTPWDRFVYNLVTATGTVEENPAVTYFLANRAVDKLTDGVTQHFLGVQLQCAQCHNHPFTEWKQTEYWGMAGFFAKVKPDIPKNPKNGADNTKIGVQEGPGRVKAKDFFPESAKTVPVKFLGGPEPQVSPTEPYRPVLAKWLTAPGNPYFAKAMVNRTWAQLFGSGFVNPIDDMHDGNPASHPELLEALARNFAGNGFDVKYLYRAICNSQAYQRTSKPAGGNHTDDQLFSHVTVKVMSPAQLYDSLMLVVGPDRPTAPAPRPAGQRRPAQRDQFVQFFLAGGDGANATEYEAGIPQALRLMNSRIVGNPNVVRQYAGPRDKPADAIERIYAAALSRKPTAAELKRLTEYVSKADTPVAAYGDILWVVLNSSEFTMVK
jgi:hypothetical protein